MFEPCPHQQIFTDQTGLGHVQLGRKLIARGGRRGDQGNSLAASRALFDVRDQPRLALRPQRRVDRGSARRSGDALAEGALRPFGQAADRVRAILRRCRPDVESPRALR